MNGDMVRHSDGTVSRGNRRAARSIERSTSFSQVRMARVADEADVQIEKIEQGTFLVANAAMAVTKIAGTIKQLEEQSGGDMALSARLQRLGDRHEWLVGQSIEDFNRSIRGK